MIAIMRYSDIIVTINLASPAALWQSGYAIMALGPLVAEDIVGQVTAVHDTARVACHLLYPIIWHLPQLWQQ
jgi:hypothetical protein